MKEKSINFNTVLLVIIIPLLGLCYTKLEDVDKRLTRVEQQLIDTQKKIAMKPFIGQIVLAHYPDADVASCDVLVLDASSYILRGRGGQCMPSRLKRW